MADYLRVSKTRIKFRRQAFADVRTSPETNAALQTIVDDILADVGGEAGTATNITSEGATTSTVYENYAGGVNPGRHRSRGYVVTTGWRAMRHEARDHTLVRALANRAGRYRT